MQGRVQVRERLQGWGGLWDVFLEWLVEYRFVVNTEMWNGISLGEENSWVQNIAVSILLLLNCIWLCNPMGCSPPGSSVHRISQARILEWVAISFSRRSFWPWDQICISCIAGRFFTTGSSGKERDKQTQNVWSKKVRKKMIFFSFSFFVLPFCAKFCTYGI